MCEGFDDPARFAPAVYPASGLYPASNNQFYGAQDTSVRTSGAGSLRFNAGAVAANTSGQWVQDIGATFAENSTLYVQYRYRTTQGMLQGTGNGRKLAVFHYGFQSCADLEIATQNTYWRGFPQMYTDCGSQNGERTVGNTIYVQQGADPFPNGAGWNCAYGNYSAATCSMFRADTWMTLSYRVDIGTWGQPNSRIQAWVGYEGEALRQFTNLPNYRINNAPPVSPGFDHITLTTYDTNATTTASGSVWYDELIVSRQPIAAPGATPIGPDTTPPTAPATLNATATSAAAISLSWPAATDNVMVTGYRVNRCTGAGCTPSAQHATTTTVGYVDTLVTPSTSYSYRVVAVDSAGNLSPPSPAATALTQPLPANDGGTSNLPQGSGWHTLPNTTLNAVCAATNGFPQVWGAEGCFGILSWSGGAFDSRRNRLIVTGGGHNGYYGNELYALDLGTRAMTRLNDPGLPIANGCQEAIAGGTQPNSRHTYDGIEYMPNVDRLFVFSGSLACGPGTFGQDTWTFDFAAMTWRRMSPTGPLPVPGPGVMTAYDPHTGRVYVHDLAHLYAYDFTSNSYTRISTSAVSIGYHMMGVIDPVRRRFVIVGYDSQAAAGRVFSYDIGPATNGQMTTRATTGGASLISQTYPGLEYDPVRDRIVAWNGGAVFILDPAAWAWTSVNPAGGPSGASQSGRGTHGRWRYSPANDVFVLVNESSQNGRIFRMP